VGLGVWYAVEVRPAGYRERCVGACRCVYYCLIVLFFTSQCTAGCRARVTERVWPRGSRRLRRLALRRRVRRLPTRLRVRARRRHAPWGRLRLRLRQRVGPACRSCYVMTKSFWSRHHHIWRAYAGAASCWARRAAGSHRGLVRSRVTCSCGSTPRSCARRTSLAAYHCPWSCRRRAAAEST
jgi:hypothetical protein